VIACAVCASLPKLKTPGLPKNEAERLRELAEYRLLDTEPEPAFDALTKLAAHVADTPIALVSIVDADRQWFKSRCGLDATETPRDVSFCGHVVESEEALVVNDAFEDDRFADNPLVTGGPHVRFYSGTPLRTKAGFVLGTLCVIDSDARTLTDEQHQMLGLLAEQVSAQLELRKTNIELATFQTFFRLSLNLLCTADDRLHFKELNPAWVKALGWSLEELRARPFVDFVHPDDLERTMSEAGRLLEDSSSTVGFENRYKHKDGHWVPLSWISAVKDSVFYATATDMSDYARKEAELQKAYESSRLLATVVESSDDAIITKSIDGVITSWNQAAVRMFGHAEDDAIGQPIVILCPPGCATQSAAVLDQLRAGNTVTPFETTQLHKLGHHLDVSVALSPLRDAEGAVTGASMIVRDISERKRLERMQAEFVSTVSHELRTPLTSIRGSLGLVAGGVTGALPLEAKQFVDIAVSNADRLVRLINDILDIEKMTSGQMEFRLETTSLSAAIDAALEANQAYAKSENARLTLTEPVPGGEVLVDRDRLAQVLANLISNAAKFSPKDGVVELRATHTDDWFRVEVRDHGPGIPESFRDRIFQRFAQADASTTREKGGTGLGLSISQAIIEEMQGRIGFDAADSGGTVFYFELPRLPPVEAATNNSGSKRLLVCEDDLSLCASIRGLFTSLGYAVDVSPTLERARRLLAVRKFDAITLDLRLADGEGVELIDDVRSDAQNRLTPIVVLSGSPEARQHSAVSVHRFITKPFDQGALIDAVSTAAEMCKSPKPRLLHVEDEPDLQRVVQRTLPSDWTVVAVSSVAEAKATLAESSFDVVLLDLGLPDGDGAELLNHVGEAQVIVFSASEASADLSRRVSKVMVKSRADPVDVRDVVRSLLAD